MPESQLGFVILLGISVGIIGVLFKKLMLDVMNTVKDTAMLTRLLFAGLITAFLAVIIPTSLGPGLSTIQQVVQFQDQQAVLLTLLLAKLVASAIALGMGTPGGLIGAAFGVGAAVAALFVNILVQYQLIGAEHLDSYILLGMAGILAACIHALWPLYSPLSSSQAVSKSLYPQCWLSFLPI